MVEQRAARLEVRKERMLQCLPSILVAPTKNVDHVETTSGIDGKLSPEKKGADGEDPPLLQLPQSDDDTEMAESPSTDQTTPHVSAFQYGMSLADLKAFREHVLLEFLSFSADIGDVQSAVAVALVFKDTVEIDPMISRHWFYGYIDLLHSRRLFNEAALVISKCGIPDLGQMNQKMTSIYVACPSCGRSSQHGGSHCKHCHGSMSTCVVW